MYNGPNVQINASELVIPGADMQSFDGSKLRIHSLRSSPASISLPMRILYYILLWIFGLPTFYLQVLAASTTPSIIGTYNVTFWCATFALKSQVRQLTLELEVDSIEGLRGKIDRT